MLHIKAETCMCLILRWWTLLLHKSALLYFNLPVVSHLFRKNRSGHGVFVVLVAEWLNETDYRWRFLPSGNVCALNGTRLCVRVWPSVPLSCSAYCFTTTRVYNLTYLLIYPIYSQINNKIRTFLKLYIIILPALKFTFIFDLLNGASKLYISI